MPDFDPYHRWLGIPPDERPISKYRLLALGEYEGDPEVINAAAEGRTLFLRTMQAGEHADLVAQVLNEVSSARVTLLDPEQKSAYDAQLRSERSPKQAQPTPAASPIVQPAAPAVNLPAIRPSGPRNVATPREQTGFQIVWKRPKVIGLSIAGSLLILVMLFMLGGSKNTPVAVTSPRPATPSVTTEEPQEEPGPISVPTSNLPPEPVGDPEPKSEPEPESVSVADQLRQDFDTGNPNLPDIDSVKRRINESAGTNKTIYSRDPRVRQQILFREGGTSATEAAVARGLEWLARHQEPGGYWSLHKFNTQAGCTCQDRGSVITDAGATALALLPFLGAGQTHIAGMYKDEVRAGLAFLLDNQAPDGNLSTGARGNTRLYTHGQAAIVLCEAYMMSGDQRLKQPAQNAITFIIAAQHHQGGWRYNPGQAGDTSVVGWQIMALQSARAAGLQVPNSVLQKANQFLNSVQAPNQLYAYQPRVSPTHVMTAEAILCRYYLGHGRNASTIATGINHLIDNHLPNRSGENIYYLYYGTQVMHHYGGPEWDLWNDQMRELLISTQHSDGHRRGSWTPKATHDRQGGRLYATAMAVCCLEVYYRHLPIFREVIIE